MKMLNKVVPALILPLVSPALVADTEFGDSVPREVVMQFVGGNPLSGAQGRLYSDILADFPAFEVPDDFSVLASADQGYVRRVILKTGLNDAATQQAIADALTDAGWTYIPDPGVPGRQQTGFIGANSPAMYQQFCNDELGNITVSVTQGAAVRYANLTHNVTAIGNQPTCAQRLDPAFQQFGPRGFGGPQLAQYIPRLVMPTAGAADANQPRIVDAVSFATGGGGGSNDYESRGNLRTDLSIDAIAQHFIEQIEEQGWAPDSEVTGAVVASGSWTKTVDDMDLIGTLLIVQQDGNIWDLRFRVLRKNAPGAGGGVFR